MTVSPLQLTQERQYFMYRLGSLVELLEKRLNTLEERYFVLLNRVEELQRIANATVSATNQSQPSSPTPVSAASSSSPTPASASSPTPVSAASSSSPTPASASSPTPVSAAAPVHVSLSMTPIPATDARNDMISLLVNNNHDNDAKVVQAITDLIGPVEDDGDIF